MKRILTFLSLLLVTFTGLTQSNFPVEVKNQYSAIPKEAYQGATKNNAYSMSYVLKSAVNAATNTSIGHIYSLTSGFGPQAGKAAIVRGFLVSSEKSITVQIRMGVATGPLNGINVPEMDLVAVIPGGTQPTWLPVDWVIRNGQSVIVYCLNFLNSADTASWVGVSPDTYYITDDFNYNARKTIMWIGTSITNGSGPTATAYMYHTMVKEYFRTLGASVRMELHGISGSTSSSHLSLFNKGAYDITSQGTPPDVVVLELAVNDASAGISVSTSIANYTSYCLRYLNHPEKKDIRVIVQGATPLQNTTAYNNAQALDSALNVMVTGLKSTYGERISFVRLSNTFPRTTFSYYASTDTNGSGIHPNDTGSPLVYTNGWFPYLTTTTDGQKLVTWIKK